VSSYSFFDAFLQPALGPQLYHLIHVQGQYSSPFQGNSSLTSIRLSFTLVELFFPLNVVVIFSDCILAPTAGKFREPLLTERLFHYEIKSSADSPRLESKGSVFRVLLATTYYIQLAPSSPYTNGRKVKHICTLCLLLKSCPHAIGGSKGD
jgi:hypothetical protein